MAKRKSRSLLQKFEKLHLITKFAIMGGSGYLLWKRWEREQAIDQAQVLQAQISAASASPATRALVTPTAEPIPHREPSILRTTITPEQVETAQALAKPQDILLQGASNTLQNLLAQVRI